MNNFREKSQVFIIGLMAGLIIAGGFFILKLDDYFKELNFYKNIAKTFHQNAKNAELTVQTEEIVPVKEKKSKEIIAKNKSVSSIDSTNIKKVKTDFVLDADTLKSYLAKDSLGFNASATSEDVIVRKDELLSTKTIEVINLNSIVSHISSKDSLLQKVSGIKDDRNDAKQFVNIELWQSPLNYKGYKMSKYKIVLYGIASIEGLKVFTMDDVIYLKHGALVYKLENSSEFRPYERTTEDSIISKLK